MPERYWFKTASAIVALADVYQFGPAKPVAHARVESRMFLWCKSGRGRVTVNGSKREFFAGNFLLLPWAHAVRYEPDTKDPFFLGGIHILPYHARNRTLVRDVAHRPDDGLAGSRERADAVWPGLDGLVGGTLQGERLARLASYIVECFQNGHPDDAALRMLAHLLVNEIAQAVVPESDAARLVPFSLQRIREYVRTNLADRLTVPDLARIGHCSVAGVYRVFGTFSEDTPQQFVARLREQEARKLLRTTQLPVAEVGRRVGLEDPFHFSRFFKGRTGLSPRSYRRENAAF